MKKAGRYVIVGLHPAVDRTIEIERYAGEVVRGKLRLVEAAGKGANIAHNLAGFGHRLVATGFLGRWDRDFFLASFHPERVDCRFVTVDGATRQNITLIETARSRETHITAGALQVRRADVRQFTDTLARTVRRGDWLVFSGSMPAGFSVRDFRAAASVAETRGGRLCVDTSGPALREALRLRPWAIKPNRAELEELVGRPLRTPARILAAARGLIDSCARILVSLGGEGAMLVTPDGAWQAREREQAAPVSTVGCGDASFSGYLSACAEGKSAPDALRFAVACGSACARTPRASLQTRREAGRFMRRIEIREI